MNMVGDCAWEDYFSDPFIFFALLLGGRLIVSNPGRIDSAGKAMSRDVSASGDYCTS